MEMSEQEWKDVLGLSESNLDFENVLLDVFSNYFSQMHPYDMGYYDLQNVINLIKNSRWEEIRPYVETVGET